MRKNRKIQVRLVPIGKGLKAIQWRVDPAELGFWGRLFNSWAYIMEYTRISDLYDNPDDGWSPSTCNFIYDAKSRFKTECDIDNFRKYNERYYRSDQKVHSKYMKNYNRIIY